MQISFFKGKCTHMIWRGKILLTPRPVLLHQMIVVDQLQGVNRSKNAWNFKATSFRTFITFRCIDIYDIQDV